MTKEDMTTLSNMRGNKTVRLILIAVLILIAAYMLYSLW